MRCNPVFYTFRSCAFFPGLAETSPQLVQPDGRQDHTFDDEFGRVARYLIESEPVRDLADQGSSQHRPEQGALAAEQAYLHYDCCGDDVEGFSGALGGVQGTQERHQKNACDGTEKTGQGVGEELSYSVDPDAEQPGGILVATDGVDVTAEPGVPEEERQDDGQTDHHHHRVGDAEDRPLPKPVE